MKTSEFIILYDDVELMSGSTRNRAPSISTRQYRSCILLLTFHGLVCQATREAYLLHDGVSVSSNIVKRHREIDVDRKHTESVHSSAAAVAKVKAQQRYYTHI